MLLNSQRGFLYELYHDGMISDAECEELVYKIDSRIKHLQISVEKSSFNKVDELNLICPIFKSLT